MHNTLDLASSGNIDNTLDDCNSNNSNNPAMGYDSKCGLKQVQLNESKIVPTYAPNFATIFLIPHCLHIRQSILGLMILMI